MSENIAGQTSSRAIDTIAYIMDEPFQKIAMDIVGPLPRSSSGNRYVLVICDYATRYPEAVPMRAVDAESVSEGW